MADLFDSPRDFIELGDLQELIRGRIGRMEQWVRVEIESHRVSGGHHYLGLIQKLRSGEIAAKASAHIWRSSSHVISDFTRATGRSLDPGISVVMRVGVDFHPVYGLSLTVLELDASYSIGQRELERKETIRKLTGSGLIDRQKGLELPFLPRKVAVISSRDAAGYGDFIKHTDENPRGFRFDLTLFHSLMQGENAPGSMIEALEAIVAAGVYDMILILRGGGADSDLFCYDDLSLCEAIARCPVPVLTAIGHERDLHVADMVAYEHFKTPTALSDALVEWVENVECGMEDALAAVQKAVRDRIASMEKTVDACVATVKFALSATLTLCDNKVALIKAGIDASDPRTLLRQGYVLAADREGKLLRNARAASAGDEFWLRFSDGRWECGINKVEKYE